MRAYRFFNRVLNRLPDAPGTVVRAIVLGALDADALNAITLRCYEGDTGFESERFNVEQGLWPTEEECIRRDFADARSVLVAGAGGGREAIALARLGFEVTAFDPTPWLVEACRRNVARAGVVVRVLDAPPDGVPRGLFEHDAVLVGRGAYHHVPGRTRRIAFLQALRAHVRVGASLSFGDFHERDAESRTHRATHAVASLVRRVARIAEPVELGDWLTDGFQHAFTRAEIEAELRAAGFTLERYEPTPFGAGCRLANATARASE